LLVPLLILFLPESLNFMVRTGAAPERVARLLRRMFPGAAIPDDARFVLPEGEGRGVPVRELFVPERAFGTAMLWISFFVTFMLLVTNSAWSPILLKADGMEVSRSALAMAAFNFGSVIGSSAVGWLITRFGAVSVLPLSFVVAAASLIAVGQGAPSPGPVTAAEALFGLSLGCGSSGLIVLAALFYPTQIRSTGVGWAMGMGRFGSFVGPLMVGTLVAAKLSIGTIFLVIGLLCLIPVIPCALTGAGRRVRAVQA
jgi:AAHS family 4-hydroxybenzoate transporter-like MFS transporter